MMATNLNVLLNPIDLREKVLLKNKSVRKQKSVNF